MKVKITLDSGIVNGEDKRFIESLFTTNHISFKQRKSYDEYYYTSEGYWELEAFKLELLVKHFGEIIIRDDELIIHIR